MTVCQILNALITRRTLLFVVFSNNNNNNNNDNSEYICNAQFKHSSNALWFVIELV